VLVLRNREGAHAVTAVGFQARGRPKHLLQSTVRLRSARTTKLYIHDDRLGPYARAFLLPIPKTQQFNDALALQIEFPPGTREAWLIDSALIPVYPKLRLPFRSLLTLADLLSDLMEFVAGKAASKLSVEFLYRRGGTYLNELRTRRGDSASLREVVLPRWCGILRWYIKSKPIAEFVYDTTDILRDERRLGRDLIRAVTCLQPRYAGSLGNIATFFDVPCLT
jgi:hypothetical protein